MTGREIRAYRLGENMRQVDLAAMLNKELGTTLQKPDISRLENGIMVIPEKVEQYISSKIAFKAVATDSDARKDSNRVIMPSAQKKSLKSPVSRTVLMMLTSASRYAPLSRSGLARQLQTSDRNVRKCIEELRAQGYRIASDSRAYGYWLCKSDEEYKAFRRNYLSRAYRQLQIAIAMDGYTEGQMEWEDILT